MERQATLRRLKAQVRALETGRVRRNAASTGRRSGLPLLLRPGVHEVRPAAYLDTPAACAFLAALAGAQRDGRPVIWVQAGFRDRQGFGTPNPAGLAPWGIAPARTALVSVRRGEDALWAMEAAARDGALVVGEIGGARAYDLTSTRRLNLAAEATGARLFILRSHRAEAPTAAWTRWRVFAAPGAPVPWKGASGLPGLGAPRWRVELERARGAAPGDYQYEWDQEAICFHQSPMVENGAAQRRALYG